ncbi:TniQ family protein [Lichenihabitans sp. Uapishka_5]|uniref:TniQ family protein n=1 Tax=Lichenihabitans sp. Uapishka_5 TaxID=3037302 RepID=UPI0029E7DB06|nr:TniQ family protein [Lichenihabitans sp. Uapishka_5]MDX7951634.1 TniQ family protein [Lichenihabitans sp. Uapishka_5]
MSVHLPTPHPDELLYSVVCRLITRTGWTPRITANQLFGDGTWCNVDLCGRLDALASNLGPELPMTGDDILSRLTLFPFYAAGAAPKVRAEVAKLLREGTSHHAHARLGVLAQSIPRPTRLRYCPRCRDEDLERLGETYWRRSHQLPGVVACARHPAMLATSDVRAKSMIELGYRDATSVLQDVRDDASPFEPWQVERAHAVARRCSPLLDEPWNHARSPLDLGEARDLARRKGMVGAWGGIAHPRLAAHVLAFYGSDLVEAMNLPAKPSPAGELYWVKRHFVDFHHNVFPVTAVVLATALDALPDLPTPPRPFTRGRGHPPRAPRPGELDLWRAEWARTMEAAAPPKVSTARRQAQGLVLKLRAWDREWYLAFNARHRALRGSSVDYVARDAEVVAKLEEAHRALVADEDGPQRSRRAIVVRANVTPGWITDALPKAVAFLDRHVEDDASYRRRKLRLAAARLLASGRRPTPTSLATESRLGYDVVRGPDTINFARSLCTLLPEDGALGPLRRVRRQPRTS